ncbi:MAG: peptide deformylase [Thermodesulfovibrionales bacterium]
MSVLKIHTYPDEILKRPADPLKDINGKVQPLIDDMINTMHAAPGIGLAAPQIGKSDRLVVVDITNAEEEHPLIVLINPVIAEFEGKMDSEEGCLSVPDYIYTIRRHEKILVKGLDRNGKEIEIEATGLLSRALQHELDHLDGILFIDRLSKIKKEFFKKRYLKALRN